MGHIHAAAMTEYAKDAAETDKPWERWEFCHMRGEYQSLHSHPEWVEDNKYRRKPKTVLIKNDEMHWTLTFSGGGVISVYWLSEEDGINYLENGFIHYTKEETEKHFNALKSFTAQME